MIHSKLLFFALPALLVVLLLPACNRTMKTSMVKSETPQAAVQAPLAPTVPSAPVTEPPKVEKIPTIQTSELAPRQVALETPIQFRDAFFDFDKWLIREDAKKALQEDAKLLKDQPDMKIEIEGHCDQRGTEDYNLALGNRRAETVRRYLIALGVDPSRISTISYGKDKPFCYDQNEQCYQENRRDHFVIQARAN